MDPSRSVSFANTEIVTWVSCTVLVVSFTTEGGESTSTVTVAVSHKLSLSHTR